jgi:hypothetical protein
VGLDWIPIILLDADYTDKMDVIGIEMSIQVLPFNDTPPYTLLKDLVFVNVIKQCISEFLNPTTQNLTGQIYAIATQNLYM